jgi:hypothetical protein
MQYNFTIAALLILTAGAFSGCGSKGGSACNDAFNPQVTITPNSTVGENGSFTLSVYGVEGSVTYNWSGPGNFSSHDKSPQITDPVRGSNEVYTVEIVTPGGCVYTSNSKPITVTGPWNPGTLATDSNAAKIAQTDLSFNKIVGNTGSSDYMIKATSATSFLAVEFPNNVPPPEGYYTMTNSTSPLGNGQARVTCATDQMFSAGNTWQPAPGGTVYVSVDNNVTTISFSGITFTCTNNSSLGSGQGEANFYWKP